VLPARPGVRVPPNQVRIVIATEHALLGDGLRSILETRSRLCAFLDVGTGVQAALRAGTLRADVLLIDLSLAKLIVPDALRSLAAAVPVVILSDASGPIDPRMAHALGVRGVIDMRAGATALLAVVGSLLPHDDWSHANGSNGSGRREPSQALSPGAFALTQRERQVLELVAEAWANKQIAQRLDITEDTVKRHVTNMFDKIGVSNRVELALFAAQYASLLAESLSPQMPTLQARAAGSNR